jgi:pilus assembly protein CpaB
MRVSTIVMLAGAAACAAAAALLTQAWLAARTEPVVVRVAAPAVPPPLMRTVVVAAAPLKFAAVLTPEMLSEVPWPAEHVPVDTFASKTALLAGGQRVVLANIAKNEPLLASKITGPGQRASLSIMIAEGKKAVTIRVDDVLGVAGFVQPDDRVDVLLTRNERVATSTTTSATKSATAGVYTDLLLQNIRVLAIDQLAERNLPAKPVKAVTLEVETDDAQKLVLAASVGQLSLALRRAGGMETSESRRIGLEDLPASRLSEGASLPVDESDRGPLVTIIRGAGERTHYNLSAETGRAVVGVQALNGSEARARRDGGEEPGSLVQPR